MYNEENQDACNLDMSNGYHGHPYPQKFVKAKLSSPFPCNYTAQNVDKVRVMKETLHGEC